MKHLFHCLSKRYRCLFLGLLPLHLFVNLLRARGGFEEFFLFLGMISLDLFLSILHLLCIVQLLQRKNLMKATQGELFLWAAVCLQ